MRLDKYLANMGVGSRRDVKQLIAQGKVIVNGQCAKTPETAVSEGAEVICNGRRIDYKQFVYIMMNKPARYLSAREDSHGQNVALDLIGDDYNFYGLSPAGRLDKDSEGFLLLSNDGDFIHSIISPNRHVDKVYLIRTENALDPEIAQKFREGITLGDGYKCLPGEIEIKSGEGEALVTIHEGRFHQVKRMVAACGGKVTYLKRLSIGGVLLDDSLAPGEYRELTSEELEKLNEKTGN